MTTTSTVSALWRYPVKSMLGESCQSLGFEHRGVQFDRLWAVVDADGKLGSHKSTRRFRRIAGLFGFHAIRKADDLWIEFPDGQRRSHHDAQINSELSAVLGQPVTLRQEAATPHHDDGPVHLITTASLRWLQALLPASQIDIRRFRPNILLDIDGDQPLEQDWIDRKIQIGPVLLQVTSPTERCIMTTAAQQELPTDPSVMRSLAGNADAMFGVYAKVLSPGTINQGDGALIEA